MLLFSNPTARFIIISFTGLNWLFNTLFSIITFTGLLCFILLLVDIM